MGNKTKPKPDLAPIRPTSAVSKSRAHSVLIRPVTQIILSFKPKKDIDEFAQIRNACLNWIAERAGKPVPVAAWNGSSFELEEVGAQRVGAIGIAEPRYWTARLDDADKNVAQRTWVTEVGIGQAPNGLILFGVRLTCVTRGKDIEFDHSVPGFVRRIIEAGEAMLDGRLIRLEPWIVSTEEDVDDLIDLLCDPARDADVIVLSLPEGSSNPKDTAIPAHDFYKRLLGAAHVVILSSEASFHLSDRVGKEFSVFRGAVRTYVPGFNPEYDEPYRHLLGLPNRISEWSEGGPEGYAKMLISKALASTVKKPNREHRLPSYSTIRRIAAEQQIHQAKKAGTSDKDLLKLAEEEIQRLSKTIEDDKAINNDLLSTAETERNQAQQQALQAQARTTVLMRRVASLEKKLKDIDKAAIDVKIPENLEDFQAWCESNLAGEIEVLNRAYQGVKKSQYHDPKMLYQALLLLKNYYVPMRRQGGDVLRAAFIDELKLLGLEEGPTFSGDRWGEEGETYLISYAGRKRLLDRHLKKGVTKDKRHCFRVYFFWDDDTQQVLVGWLPSHLDSRQT